MKVYKGWRYFVVMCRGEQHTQSMRAYVNAAVGFAVSDVHEALSDIEVEPMKYVDAKLDTLWEAFHIARYVTHAAGQWEKSAHWEKQIELLKADAKRANHMFSLPPVAPMPPAPMPESPDIQAVRAIVELLQTVIHGNGEVSRDILRAGFRCEARLIQLKVLDDDGNPVEGALW
jgi:hypothetical protein